MIILDILKAVWFDVSHTIVELTIDTEEYGVISHSIDMRKPECLYMYRGVHIEYYVQEYMTIGGGYERKEYSMLEEYLGTGFTSPRDISNITNDSNNYVFSEALESSTNDVFKDVKKVFLLFSGGLDSTALFYSMLKCNKEFTVILTEKSIFEYYRLSSEIMSNAFSGVDFILADERCLDDTIRRLDTGDCSFVSGELGDQLFGSNNIMSDFYEDRNTQYQLEVPKVLLDDTTELLNVISNKYICNMSNWLWAANFVYRWDYIKGRLANVVGELKAGSEIVMPFGCHELQVWSVQNQIPNSKFNKETYKKDIRDYILGANGDEEYCNNKLKVESLQMTRDPDRN